MRQLLDLFDETAKAFQAFSREGRIPAVCRDIKSWRAKKAEGEVCYGNQ